MGDVSSSAKDDRDLSADEIAEYEGRTERLRGLARDIGLDAVIVGDREGRYGRYLSGFGFAPYASNAGPATARQGDPNTVVVIVPVSGEVTLVTPPGFLRSHSAAARLRSWVPRIVSTYLDDPEWEVKTLWGLFTQDTATDVATAIRESGLAEARIGVIGTWLGIERTKNEFPQASFEPAITRDGNGFERDFIDLMTETATDWEIRQLEHAQAAADDGLRMFRQSLHDGALYHDVLQDVRYATERSCTFAYILLSVSSPGQPWITTSRLEIHRPEKRFRKGDLVSVELINHYEGYWVQNCRSWVVGTAPTKNQAHVLETTQRVLDNSFERLEPGITGEQMWDMAVETFRRAGLDPWTRMGHPMGFAFHGAAHRFYDFLPEKRAPMPSRFPLVTHPVCIDRTTMTSALIGDQVILDSKGYRLLSKSPVTHDFML